jgi:MATE family multidrug resistance protein
MCYVFLFVGLVIFIFRDSIIAAFTFEDKVKEVSHSLFIFVSLVAVFDGVATITGCIFSGLGRPLIGTIIQFISNYVTALPIGVIASFVFKWGDGLFGFWWGILSTFYITNRKIVFHVHMFVWVGGWLCIECKCE